MQTFAGLQGSGTAVESTDEDTCGECAKFDDGFPCADCCISGDAEFSEDYR
ncbi:hypothetical protein NJ7G_3984 [Natrinema sp. J7-2]|uniref:Uncharacterized protein n=2 Tax=Natrialbaceae TaxID=1644061 RepID=L9YVD8_9EURY|nr:hypothetical protein NJ7G_3984 [Natrinema sp. J7-2]ELY77442.1 hypothetical protein C486_15099 [Natrinema gari JCM 14663]